MDELLTRGVANIIPSKEGLEKVLNTRKLNIYVGIDPTAVNIHLGHAVFLRKIQKFAENGHNVTFLIGDFTALIGDTSDKDSERPNLNSKEVEDNFVTYKSQAEKIVDFSKVSVKYNSQWLSKLNFEDIVRLTKIFSLNDFISRELIKKRLNEGTRVSLSETFYPLMQAYDSYSLKTDIQIGGTDQTFNMQAGRTLIKINDNRESFVMSTEFLMGTDGRKMSKSWGNAIWLTDSPFEMYRKVMAINDNQIKNYFILATDIPMDEIPDDDEITASPMEIKKILAENIVAQFHQDEDTKKAKEEFEKTIQGKEIPGDENISEIQIEKDSDLLDVLLSNNLVPSKSEGKRLVEQGGVSLNDNKLTDPDTKLNNGILKIGKREYRKIVVK
jgi:tyrosyl-tRNA synthetase